MKLVISKHGAFYLAKLVSYELNKSFCKNVKSAVLHEAMLLRRAKRIVSYSKVYLAQKLVAAVRDLPAEFTPLDVSDSVRLYNRVHSFVTNSDFIGHIRTMPKLIPVREGVI